MPFEQKPEGAVLLKDALVRKLIAAGVPGDTRDSEIPRFVLRVYGPHNAALRYRLRFLGEERTLTRKFTHQPPLHEESSLTTPRVPVNTAGFRRLIELAQRLKQQNIDPLPPKGRQRKAGTAPLPCALDPAEAWHLEEVIGDAPVIEGSVGHVVRDYLLLHAYPSMRPRSRQEADLIAKRILAARTPLGASLSDARWRDRPVASLGRKDILAALVDPLLREGKSVMARTLATWAVMILSWAERREDPAYGEIRVPEIKLKVPKSVRLDYLEAEDVPRFWRALDKEEKASPTAVAFLRTMLLIGQRPWEETAKMRWSEIRDNWWILRPDRTKSAREHRVFLCPQALEILEGQRAVVGSGSQWVFPAKHGKGLMPIGAAGASGVYSRALDNADIYQPEPNGPHGLRRTMATLMEEVLEIAPQTIAACLNHAPQGVTAQHYLAGNSRKAKQEAWTRWGAWVEEQVKGDHA